MRNINNYQTKPVYWVGSNETDDIAVRHELRNHRAFGGVTVNLHRDKTKNVGVRSVLPEDSFLAEMLRPVYTGQCRKKVEACLSDLLDLGYVIERHAQDLNGNQLVAQVPSSNVRKPSAGERFGFDIEDQIPVDLVVVWNLGRIVRKASQHPESTVRKSP